jgi:hypothetical protein
MFGFTPSLKWCPLAATLAVALFPSLGRADQPQPIRIDTVKGTHSATGTWSATGAVVDSGMLTTHELDQTPSWTPPPFLVTHVSYDLSSARGAFELQAEITETVSSTNPDVLIDTGRWTITGLSGEYSTLQGTGTVSGTVDHDTSTVTRTYEGTVHS